MKNQGEDAEGAGPGGAVMAAFGSLHGELPVSSQDLIPGTGPPPPGREEAARSVRRCRARPHLPFSSLPQACRLC